MYLAVWAHHASLGTYANQGTHSVEHIDKEKCQHNDYHVDRENAGEVKLTENRGNRRRNVYQTRNLRNAHRNTNQRGGDDADKQTSRHFLDDKHTGDDDAYGTQQGRAFCYFSYRHKSGGIGSYDACILQTYEGDKEADTCTNGTFQRGRNGINHQRTNACC